MHAVFSHLSRLWIIETITSWPTDRTGWSMALTADRIGYILFFGFIFVGLFLLMVCIILESLVMLATLCRSLVRRGLYATPPAPVPQPVSLHVWKISMQTVVNNYLTLNFCLYSLFSINSVTMERWTMTLFYWDSEKMQNLKVDMNV